MVAWQGAKPSSSLIVPSSAISLYIHIPWCVHKCPYCDFNSHLKNALFDEARYVRAIIADIKQQRFRGEQLTSIFFGGGTPSLFSADSFARILDVIHERIPVQPTTEITLEANPGTADEANFRGYRDVGINRLSIGVQSLNDCHLATIGRIHGAEDAHRALNWAFNCGFERVNADIMFALPNQSVDEVIEDVEGLLSYPIDHVSAYHFTIEPNTYFFKNPPIVPDDDIASTMQDKIIAACASAGIRRYEISAFARVGRESLHNLNYWQFGDYLGFGAGAHGKISRKDGIERQVRHLSPLKYMDGLKKRDFIAEKTHVSGDEVFIEYCMNALRLVAGFSIANCIEKTGINGSRLYDIFTPSIEEGLIHFDQTRVRTTERGYRYLDSVLTSVMYNSEKLPSSNYA